MWVLTKTLLLSVAIGVFVAGCQTLGTLSQSLPTTTNHTFLNDYRKKPQFSDFDICGLVVPKSAIDTKQNWQSALNSFPDEKTTIYCWEDSSGAVGALEACRKKRNQECFITFFKYKNTSDDRVYHQSYDLAVSKIKKDNEQVIKGNKEQRRRANLAAWSQTCTGFGYEAKTDKHKACMLELYKLENQPRASNNNSDSAAVRALLEEQRRQREVDSGLEMMKRGLDMMGPKPSVTCQFNNIMNTMVCR